MASLLLGGGDDGTLLTPSETAAGRPGQTGVRVIISPWSGDSSTGAELAVLSESGPDGPAPAHGPCASRARATETFFDDLKPAPTSFPLPSMGWVRFTGMVTVHGRTERDYLLLEYRGGDKLYVRRIRSTC